MVMHTVRSLAQGRDTLVTITEFLATKGLAGPDNVKPCTYSMALSVGCLECQGSKSRGIRRSPMQAPGNLSAQV